MISGPATTELLRGLNRSAVMRVIRRHGPVSRAEIGRLAKISPASVSAIVAGLVADGLVREDGHTTAEVGRPGRLLRFSDDVLFLGCDLASSEGVRAGLMSLSGDLVETRILPWPTPQPGPEQAAAVIAGYLADAARRHGPSRIAAAGIGLPGVVDPVTSLVRSAPLLGWSDVDLAGVMAARLPIPVILDNDVNLALAAEVDRGAASDARFAVLVSFAEGIGGAVLVDGQIYRGRRGSAGEIGHIVLDTAGSGGDYRQVGAAEKRIFELVAEDAKREGIEVSDHDEQTAHLAHLVSAARGSLTFTEEIETELSVAIAAVLASASALVDPDVIILSGWVSLGGQRLLDRITENLQRYVLSVPEIRFSAVGDDCVAIGAALAACQSSLAGVQVVGAQI
jgi:N-acetylglucosamine repressor